jgi:hypothetical protein
MPDLHDLWALPLAEQQAKRVYRPWGHLRFIQLARENAAPDFPKAGRFYLQRCLGTGDMLVIDPERPWNDAIAYRHADELVAKKWGEEHS